jgi:hypothetical protein
LPRFYARYANADSPKTIAEIEEMRQTVVSWWKAFKTKQQSKVNNLIQKSFARTS